MRQFILLVVLLWTIPIFAQDADPASNVFQALEASNVRLDLTDDGEITLVFNASPAVCEELLVDIVVDEGFIDINALVPRTDSVCNTFAPYEPTLALPDLPQDQTYILFLNNFTTTFYLPAVDDNNPTEPFSAVWGRENSLAGFDVVQPLLETITVSGDNTLTLSGNHPDGCETQEFLRVWDDPIQLNLVHVDSFRLLPQGVMCPSVLVEFEATADIDYPDGTIIEIDGVYGQLADGELLQITPTDITIGNVEILETANGAIVVAQGQETMSCGEDIELHQIDRDYATLIEIVSYRNVNLACDNEISEFEQTFTGVTLPVIINGVGYDADGTLEPIVSAQSDDSTAGGNQMVVDTVIESVEVAILESFPMQLQLTVSGFQPDGCDFPVEIEQTVNGNDVTLHIFRRVPADIMCPMMLNPYEESILVDGSFEGGTVNIQINEFSLEVDL